MRTTTVADREDLAQHFLHHLPQDGEFTSFFKLYDDISQNDSGFNASSGHTPWAKLTQGDIMYISNTIRQNLRLTKAEIANLFLKRDSRQYLPSTVGKAINLAVQAMAMIDSSASEWHSTNFMLGDYRPVSWLETESFVDFFDRSFPRRTQLELDSRSDDAEYAVGQKADMKAWKLQKHLGIRFRPTDNLAEHLIYDPREGELHLFHHAAYLKAHLNQSRGEPEPLGLGTEASLKRGLLPPQLLVETLHSIQAIIFPSIDPKSARLLENLVDKGKFDPKCTQYEGYEVFREVPEEFRYIYWGKRLAKLYDLVLRPPPRSRIERWCKRQSSEGHALLLALLAVLISIIVGIVGIILGCVQIWLTWMAWQHPAR